MLIPLLRFATNDREILLAKQTAYHIHAGSDAEPGLIFGLLTKRGRERAAPEASTKPFRCTVSVRSAKETMAAIEAAGGTLRSSVVDIPHVGHLAEFADSEGNIACIP